MPALFRYPQHGDLVLHENLIHLVEYGEAYAADALTICNQHVLSPDTPAPVNNNYRAPFGVVLLPQETVPTCLICVIRKP
jgi:hypothetical protein